jgi:hypothetical protein
MQSPDCQRVAPLSGEANNHVGARPSKCIIIIRKAMSLRRAGSSQAVDVTTFPAGGPNSLRILESFSDRSKTSGRVIGKTNDPLKIRPLPGTWG